MRPAVLTVLAIAACTTRTDAPLDVDPPAETPACTDVATASLNLADATPAPVEGCGEDVVAVALSQFGRWTLTRDRLDYEGGSIALIDVHGTDVAAGYGPTAFILDGTAGAVLRAEGDALVPLAEDDSLKDARALVRVGGTLFVGTPRGVWTISLAEGTLAQLRSGLDVLDLTVDDIGAIVLLTPEGLTRMLPSGDPAPMPANDVRARRIAFELVGSALLTVDEVGAIGRLDYAELVPEGPDSRPVHHGDMGPFHASGYILAGAEYWPHRGSTPAKYPEEILWGFYPHQGEVFEGAPARATATEAAVSCAERSHAALRAWIPTATEALAGATKGGKAPRFYLWVNDYSESTEDFEAPMREAKLWYWARDPEVPGRIPGYFKWETVLAPDGRCSWPSADQAAAFLRDAASN